jgi:hypothetical protein
MTLLVCNDILCMFTYFAYRNRWGSLGQDANLDKTAANSMFNVYEKNEFNLIPLNIATKKIF